MKRFFALPLATSLSLAVFIGAASGDGHVTKEMTAAIEARQAQMTLISQNMGILGAMAKGEAEYDSSLAAAAASNLAAVAKLERAVLWVEGSIQGDVPDTRAKAEIWSDAAGFEKASVDLESAAESLVVQAGTDLASLQAGMKAVGATCGVCHKAYRGPRN